MRRFWGILNYPHTIVEYIISDIVAIIIGTGIALLIFKFIIK